MIRCVSLVAAVLTTTVLLGRVASAQAAPRAKPGVLLADDFSSYPAKELLDKATYGPRLGPWELMTLHFSWRSPRYNRQRAELPFRIIDRDGRRFLDQPESLFNVVLKAGDPRWRDYVLELELAVNDGPAGPIVRYKTNRQNYWLSFQGGQSVKLWRRNQDEHVLLGEAAGFEVQKDRLYRCRVTCDGPRLSVAVDGRELISVKDDAYPVGQIALRTDGPSRFTAVRVLPQPGEAERLAAEIKQDQERIAAITATLPPAKIVDTVTLPQKPLLVLGMVDLNGDGTPEIVAYYPSKTDKDAKCLGVHDWRGKPLWTLEPAATDQGKPASPLWRNVADIDADGHTEVIVTRGVELLVVDGATGQVKRRMLSPVAVTNSKKPPARASLTHCMVCNLRGLPTPRDLVVKDEYWNLWAVTDDFKPLWHRQLNTGHHLVARDVDGDGKDEVMGGYSLLGPDGTTRWTVPGCDPLENLYPGSEHVDGVLIDRLGPGPDAPLRVALAASDMGFILLDVKGRILSQQRIGHAQWITAGRFQPELPGRQIAVGTTWGNHGIFYLFDCDGKLIFTREIQRSQPWPIYWLGTDRPLFLIRGWATGFWNADNDRIFRLPGHMLVPPHACDLNHDGLDELLVLEENKIHVYSPEGVKARFPPPPVTLTNWYSGSLAR